MGKVDLEGKRFLILGVTDNKGDRVITAIKLTPSLFFDEKEYVNLIILGSTGWNWGGSDGAMLTPKEADIFLSEHIGEALAFPTTDQIMEKDEKIARRDFLCSLWRPKSRQTNAPSMWIFITNCSGAPSTLVTIKDESDLFGLLQYEDVLLSFDSLISHKK
jgi:hypothetical protein